MKKLLLTAAFACAACVVPAFAQEEESTDIIHELSLETGSYSGNGTWHNVYNTSGNAHVTVTASASNMGSLDGVFDFRSGSALSSTYTITENYYYYYVSGFSFKAKMGGDDTTARSLQIDGHEEVALTEEEQLFEVSGLEYGTNARFYIKGANQPVLITDFTVTLSLIPDEEFAAEVTEHSGVIELWRPVLGEDLYAEQKALIDAELNGDATNVNKSLAIQAINNSWMAEANGRLIYIKNVRRPEANGKYLNGYANGTANTVAAPVAQSNWCIDRIGTSMTFHLFNPETNKYVATDGSLVDANATNVATLELKKNESGNPGTAFHIVGGDNGLNVNSGTGNLTYWSWTDGGSSWEISLAGVPASEIQNGKYYRIRSARSLNLYRSEGSLLGVNTAVEDNQPKGDVPNDGSKFSGLGTIWKVEDAGDGKHYLRNVATDSNEGMNYFGTGAANCNNPASSALGMFEFLSKDSKWDHKHPNAVIIKNQNGAYIDKANGVNNSNIGTWTMCDNNWPNNGGIYFFEEATDLDALQQAYIDDLNNRNWTDAIKDNIVNEIQHYSKISAIWTPEATSEALAAIEAMGEASSAITTVADANELIWAGSLVDAAPANDIFAKFFASADGQLFTAENIGRNGGHGDFMASVESEESKILGISHDAADLAAHWSLQLVPDTKKFLVKNYLNNEFAGFNSTFNVVFPVVATEAAAEQYEIVICEVGGEGVVGFNSAANATYYGAMHEVGARNAIVRWNAPSATDNSASAWRLAAIDSEELIPSVENTHVILSSDAGAIDKHAVYGDHHVITLSKVEKTRALSEPMTVSPADVEITSDGTAKIDFGTELESGDYTLTVPASVFKVNGKVSAPINHVFTVDDNGNTTGVKEIGTVSDVKAIYDLQGRRVKGNAKGLLIVNGKKTVVK